MSKRIITLGTWEGEPIEWIVLNEDNASLFCVAKKVLFSHCFNDNANKGSNYSTSDIRKYLNNEFWNTAFTDEEKKRIVNTKLTDANDTKDDVFLLSTSEIESLMTKKERVLGRWWYTRTAKSSNKVYDHRGDDDSFGEFLTDNDGIRPAIRVKA